MILVFTSVTDGGIVQFSIQVTTELIKKGIPCRCFLPNGFIGTISDEIKPYIYEYEKVKTISLTNKELNPIVEKIKDIYPDIIWYIDAGILSSEICIKLSRSYKQYITLHDPVRHHPTNTFSIYNNLKEVFFRFMSNTAVNYSDKVILLSEESRNQYLEKHKNQKNKLFLFNLGAHIPEIKGIIPPECENVTTEFILFFGRIDKYKGISTLLKAFKECERLNNYLIIAGKGDLTEEERYLMEQCKNLILVNRYITDAEQIWLFQNSKVLMLPYIEASQSGIIPLAYKFGKPVIVSNIPGLTQFVNDGETGFICDKIVDYVEALDNVYNTAIPFSENCIKYYDDNLDWSRSIERLFPNTYHNEQNS